MGHRETCEVCEIGLDGRKKSRGDGVIMLALYTRRIPGTGVRDSDRPCNTTYLPTPALNWACVSKSNGNGVTWFNMYRQLALFNA